MMSTKVETTPRLNNHNNHTTSYENNTTCLICCRETLPQQRGLTPCGHDDVCGLCHLRLRFLHEDKRCPICKAVNDKIIVDDDAASGGRQKNFSMYTMWGDNNDTLGPEYILKRDCGIFFKQWIYDEHISCLFSNKCYMKECAEVKNFNGRKALEQHLKTAHNMFLCELCVKNKRDFVSKLPRFTLKELKEHQTTGMADIPGDKGHPECQFCNKKRFYDISKLYEHLNIEHYKCHVCEKNDITDQFFNNYGALERHFDNKHYLCRHPDCIAARFVVFDNDICLKAHERTVHRVGIDAHTSTKIQLQFNIRRQGHDGSGYDADNQEYQSAPSTDDFNFSLAGQPTTISNPPTISNPLHAARTAQIINDAALIREQQQLREHSQSFPSLSDTITAATALSNNNLPTMAPSGWVNDNNNNNYNQTTSNNTIRKPSSVKGRVQPQDFPSLPSAKPNPQLLAARQLAAANYRLRNPGTNTGSNWSSTNTASASKTLPTTTATPYYSSGYAASTTANDFPSLFPSKPPKSTSGNATTRLHQHKPALDSSNDFPSLSSSKPKSNKQKNASTSTPKYQAAANYAKKMQSSTTASSVPIPTLPPPVHTQPLIKKTPQFTTNNFPTLFTSPETQTLLTLPEIKSLLSSPTYKTLRTYLKQFASNQITTTQFINQSKDLFSSSSEDSDHFWKVLPSVLQSCPEGKMKKEGLKYLETLKKREDQKANTVYLTVGEDKKGGKGNKKSSWGS